MKRLCTEAEKNVLYKNRGQMLEGILWTASQNKLGHVFVRIFLSAIVMLVVGVWAAITFELPKFVFLLVMLVCFRITDMILFVIMSNLKVKKEAKAFLKQKNLMVNGATIVAVNEDSQFAYIEDDLLDEDGKPIIIVYPSCPHEVTPEDFGNRILVMYDDDSNFQLLKLNDELRSFIPNYARLILVWRN